MKNMIPKNEREIVEMADVLKQRVIEGQPLVVTGTLDDAMVKRHAATVNGGVVAQMPVAAEVGSGDERDELGSG